MNLTPVMTEKAMMLIERDNTLTFVVDSRATKTEIKQKVETLLETSVQKARTLMKDNKKYVYVQLKKNVDALDVATKLGLM